ncbi:hypothetical protein ZWY2020_047050 [Hordeum vulgare]|uniref:Uncharacterized protein n=1 Tax=Hordeum vulgare subsp. vulgare TaxID=112509 RepID=A0A8I6Y038_HORVV|nr:hypothetical protein ZWY2020_047050 [Hordeum vulgare]
MPFHFHCHLSWSAPSPVEQAAYAWVLQDMYVVLVSVSTIWFLVELHDKESESSCTFGSDNPCIFNSVASLYAVEYMAYMAWHIRWRWVRNLSAMPTAVACILVNSPAVIAIIVVLAFLWGHLFGDPQFVTCLSWLSAAALVVFLWWCICIDRTISKNSPLPHLQEETCKNGGVLHILACDY